MNKQRVTDMETVLNETADATAALWERLDRMDALKDGMTRLFSYYGSKEWYDDREGDTAGLAAGVLSEDAVYDAITDVRAAAIRMLETATDILKNRL